MTARIEDPEVRALLAANATPLNDDLTPVTYGGMDKLHIEWAVDPYRPFADNRFNELLTERIQAQHIRRRRNKRRRAFEKTMVEQGKAHAVSDIRWMDGDPFRRVEGEPETFVPHGLDDTSLEDAWWNFTMEGGQDGS